MAEKTGAKKPATFTTAGGQVSRRSRSMPKARAEAFAKCLSANGRFDEATVHETKSGSARFFVAFRPAKESGQDSIFLDYQQEQIDRAVVEMNGYDFVPDGAGGATVTTLPDAKGHRDTYRVMPDLNCDCPHYVNRLQCVGCFCKHGAAWYAKRVETDRRHVEEADFIAARAAEEVAEIAPRPCQPTPKFGFSADFERRRAADFD